MLKCVVWSTNTIRKIAQIIFDVHARSLLEQLPFLIKGFHADNGSEYINHKGAEILNGLMIHLTKYRPRHSNECVACPWV